MYVFSFFKCFTLKSLQPAERVHLKLLMYSSYGDRSGNIYLHELNCQLKAEYLKTESTDKSHGLKLRR